MGGGVAGAEVGVLPRGLVTLGESPRPQSCHREMRGWTMAGPKGTHIRIPQGTYLIQIACSVCSTDPRSPGEETRESATS